MRRNHKAGDYVVFFIFLALATFVGDLLGELLSPYAPIVGRYARLGFSPVEVSLLHLVEFTFGLSFRLNILGAIFGGLLTLFLWTK